MDWYLNNSDVLTTSSIIEDALRTLGMTITKLLCSLGSIGTTIYDKTFGMLDITTYGKVNELLAHYKPLFIGFTTICIIALGIQLIIDHEKKPRLIRNIFLTGLILSSSLYLFTTLNQLTFAFKEDALSQTSKNMTYSYIDNNIVDLISIDKRVGINNLNYKAGKGIIVGAGITDDRTLKQININETLNYSDVSKGKNLYGWSDAFQSKFSREVRKVGDSYIEKEVNAGLFGIGNEFYYRYKIDFLGCWIQIIAVIIMFFALAYKNVRFALELVVARILVFFTASDLTSGEKTKNLLLFIRDTYITICVSILCVKVYSFLTAYITSTGATGLLKGVLSLFVAIVVIDGPTVVQRAFGQDVGLSAATARTAAMFGLHSQKAKDLKDNLKTRAQKGAKLAGAGIAAFTNDFLGSVSTKKGKNLMNNNKPSNTLEAFGKAINDNIPIASSIEIQEAKSPSSNSHTSNTKPDLSFMNENNRESNSVKSKRGEQRFINQNGSNKFSNKELNSKIRENNNGIRLNNTNNKFNNRTK